jgi:hypothetical protein
MITAPNWLRTFFDLENKIKLDKVLDKSYALATLANLEPLIIPACKEEWPIILPMSSETLSFYALAKDTKELIELKRVLRSFLGSAETYPELPIIKLSENETEKALLSKFPSGFIKFVILEKYRLDLNAKENVFKSLAKVLEVYSQRPNITTNAPRPIGRVLRDFFTACQTSDAKNAYNFLDEINGSGVFSQRNLLFLELQALFADQKWYEIIEHKNCADLLSGRVPQRITQLLLRSIGKAGLDELCQDVDFSSVEIESFRILCEKLSPLFERQPNFESHPSLIDDWKLWAIGAALLGLKDFSRYLPSFVDSDWITKVSKWVGFDQAIPLSIKPVNTLKKPTNLDEVTTLLKQALLSGQDELDPILELLSNLPSELSKQLKEYHVLNTLMESLLVEQRVRKGNGWVQWFSEMSKKNATLTALGQEFHGTYLIWKTESFDEVEIIKHLENSSSSGAGGVFRDILPLLVGWLNDREIKCSVKFWIIWLELLALDDFVSSHDLILADLLINQILTQSFSKEEYLKMLEPLEVLWEKGNSPSGYSSVLELIETLIDLSCPDNKARMEFWLEIQSYALSKWNRLDISEHFLTKCIANEILGESALNLFPNALSDEDNIQLPDALTNLKGKLLAIHTLTEGAARRAKVILESMFIGLEVEINHDHTATSNLKNLAKKADYFIFSTASSKHQAFNPVSKIRNDLIYPQGKGASSIINSFLGFIT